MVFKKLAVVLLALAVAGAAFAKDNLAILPFTGGTGEEGEIIAELFSFSNELNTVFAPIPRTSITRAVNSEQRFQRNTGMTDPDTIVALGKQLGANYVVVGNIGKLGKQNLLTIAILKIDDLRQVAGDIQTYVDRKDIQGKLPSMARNIIEATKIDASRLEKLAVTPVDLGRDIDARVADMLAQILAVNLIRSGKYAVYPRTATLEQAQEEYKNQRSGITADENIVDMGKGENPRLALSVVARRWDNQNMFNAAIINLESGVQVIGGSVDYNSLDDGIKVMESLAGKLTGVSIPSTLSPAQKPTAASSTAQKPAELPSNLALAESLKWISANAKEGGNYTVTLKNNETLAPQSLSYNGKKVSITLDGGTAERTLSLNANGSLFSVGSGVTLVLGNNVSLRGRSSNTAALVWVNDGGTLAMKSGSKISGNSAEYGGGVYVNTNATFTMSGGTISGNSAGEGGGGVCVSGTFTQSGGTISGNSAGGGGVDVWGTFTMSGGSISGNSAGGGGVDVNHSGTFTMSGGTISDNKASSIGGGVDVWGTFTMSGGTISGNKTSHYGGGVFVFYGTFTKESGGAIYGSDASSTVKNTARNSIYGHAVYCSDGAFITKKRNRTAGSGVRLDSAVRGRAGGWE